MKSLKVLIAGLLLSSLLGGHEAFGAALPEGTRTNSGGGVTVSVTPLDSTAQGDLRFQIAMNTHSVALDGYDLKSLAVLRDGAANIYHPTSVETKGSGHHRQATLTFGKPKNGVKHIELVVKGVAGVHERVFQWDLK
ncbi:MAG: hypothetical protein ACM3SP_22485 [Chloroflexota bacterium]